MLDGSRRDSAVGFKPIMCLAYIRSQGSCWNDLMEAIVEA